MVVIITAVEATKPTMMALFSAATSSTERARASVDQLYHAWVPLEEDRMMYSVYKYCPPIVNPPELE